MSENRYFSKEEHPFFHTECTVLDHRLSYRRDLGLCGLFIDDYEA